MPLKQDTPTAALVGRVAEETERRTRAVVYLLEDAGAEAVRTARELGSYTDRTGNLRSSVGFAVVSDGGIVRMSDFAAVRDGAGGAEMARAWLESLAGRFTDGITLVVVAGMRYAAYVAARGYDVIDSAETIARRLVDELTRKSGV